MIKPEEETSLEKEDIEEITRKWKLAKKEINRNCKKISGLIVRLNMHYEAQKKI